MKILNIRGGIACNSSSTHSLLIPNDPTMEFVRDLGEQYDEDTVIYDWQHFTETDIAQYLVTGINSELLGSIGMVGANAVIKELFGIEEFNKKTEGGIAHNVIDHQSEFSMPRSPDGKHLNLEFMQDFIGWAKSRGVVALGGNDNDEYVHDLLRFGVGYELPAASLGSYRARADGMNDGVWSLYNPSTGMKIRLWLGEGEEPETLRGVPELVDIKVSDFCPFNCDFCYQGSTKDGQHADVNIYKLSDAIADIGIWEVALGGGEPTMWPYFSNFVGSLSGRGVNVSLTTRNPKWLMTYPIDSIAAVAYSTEDLNDTQFITSLAERWGSKLTIQVVEGLVPLKDIRRFISRNRFGTLARVGITILGFKETGRGEDHEAADKKYSQADMEMFEVLCQEYGSLRVDTAFVRNHPEIAASYSPLSFHSSEGSWSAYMDLVQGAIAPSSYSSPEKYINIEEWNTQNILQAFSDINVDW